MKMVYAGVRATDLDRSFEFHTKALVLEQVRRGDMTKHGRGRWILLRDRETGQQPELNWYANGSEFDKRYPPGEGLDHIGFEVPDA